MDTQRGKKKIKFGVDIFHGECPEDLPLVQLADLDEELVASYTGPDKGLAYLLDETKENNGNVSTMVAGVDGWNKKEQQAYGICISLYEQHPVNKKMSGDPVADAFSICARKNNTIMVIADGVNWGEKSRLAARCCLYGSMNYLNNQIFQQKNYPSSTQEALTLLRESLDEAHRFILQKDGGLTTVCACLICPVSNSDQYAVCCVNVGDSFGFIYNVNHGIREVTIGSHDVSSERDIRDAGGALGPVDGINPELHNLTCSLSFCNAGDVVFLTTDGISDNFDPVVTKIAIAQSSPDANLNSTSADFHCSKPEMSPRERHIYSMKEMERVVHEFELITEEQCSAQELCGSLVQHVLTLTDDKRKILENPALYSRRRLTVSEKQVRDSEIVRKMASAPGKLDHASIVAVEIGAFEDKDEENDDEDDDDECELDDGVDATFTSIDTSCLSQSPGHRSKKSGARKFFSRIRKLSSPTTLPAEHTLTLVNSPKKSNTSTKAKSEHKASSPTSPKLPGIIFDNKFEARSCKAEYKSKRPYQRSMSYESNV
ncbi:uncharacterized protein LOC126820977 [Patella vulgata]|uniref:uncharacterized protein LOC126820977 n=1 Tax=Patella vulgata TaxID=6465 RepID=UPI0021800B86|nr:uncharacterized protein LOC126820977 [Patella vulgata]XP_050405171.1 uncharacterized protein LOC126820977 [Patella vulgata]